MKNSKEPFAIIVLTLLVFFLSKSPFTSDYSFQLTFLSFIGFLLFSIFRKRKGVELEQDKSFPYLLSLVILLLVASTGWFFSPFFFTLYLLAIVLAFMVTPSTSFAFIATILGLFIVTLGEIDVVYDLMVMLSYFTVVPLIFYLKSKIK